MRNMADSIPHSASLPITTACCAFWGVQKCAVSISMVKMRLGGASNRSLGNIIRKSRVDYRALKNNGVGCLLDVGGEKPEQAAAVS